MVRSSLAVLCRDVLNAVLASPLLQPRLRSAVLRRLGVVIGEGTRINARCFFTGTDVEIGSDTFINYGCFLDSGASIKIGSRCFLGMEVMLCTSTHQIGGPHRRAAAAAPQALEIGDGCWIGTRAVILPGVTIGQGCVISAGAVVASSSEPNGLYGGVPARRIRDL